MRDSFLNRLVTTMNHGWKQTVTITYASWALHNYYWKNHVLLLSPNPEKIMAASIMASNKAERWLIANFQND